MADVTDLLKRVPLFEGLSKRDLRHVAHETREQWFNPGQAIVAEGQAGGAFYLIVEGRANVKVNGRKRSTMGPGDAFGEISVIDRSPRSATVEAETRVKTLAISSHNFMSLLEEHFAIAQKVLLGLCARVRELDKSLRD